MGELLTSEHLPETPVSSVIQLQLISCMPQSGTLHVHGGYIVTQESHVYLYSHTTHIYSDTGYKVIR